jgi:medium-chain acyl-[acyl-carrier-protein] hydrolase
MRTENLDSAFCPPQPATAATKAPGPIQFNDWITCPNPKPAARLRLFCLPFAGGGASIYRAWGKALSPEIEVCPVQLPGRENRFREPAHTAALPLAEILAAQIQRYADKPFMVFGHSMGALLAFELTKILQRQNAPLPLMLFLSAHRAAHLPARRAPMHALPDQEFIEKLRCFGGFPDEILQHQDLLDFLLPTLRADLTLCDFYNYVPEEQLNCPLQLYAGRQDTEVSPEDIEAWREHTTQTANLQVFPGGHFFLRSDADALMQAINKASSRFVVL